MFMFFCQLIVRYALGKYLSLNWSNLSKLSHYVFETIWSFCVYSQIAQLQLVQLFSFRIHSIHFIKKSFKEFKEIMKPFWGYEKYV